MVSVPGEPVSRRRTRLDGGLWCCGSLQTAGVTVGVSNLTCIVLLFLWVVQIVFEKAHHFFVATVVLCMVSFLLVVVNVCLVAGAVHRRRSLVLPWMVLYVPAILSVVVSCALAFKSMGPVRPVAVAAVVILTYFYVVVAAFYHELRFEEAEKRDPEKGARGDGKVEEEDGKREDNCLIALDDVADSRIVEQDEEEEEGRIGSLANGKLVLTSSSADDTFSELASRPKLLSTNPFRDDVDGVSAEEGDEDEAGSRRRNLLPQPEEVIQVSPSRHPLGCKADDYSSSSWFDSPFRRSSSKSKSIDLTPATKMTVLGPIEEGPPADGDGCSESTSRLEAGSSSSNLVVATASNISSSRPRAANRSQSHSGLVGDIDSNFTPFKSGRKGQPGEADGEEGSSPPKMKVFLPKSPDDDDDDVDSSEDADSSEGDDGTGGGGGKMLLAASSPEKGLGSV